MNTKWDLTRIYKDEDAFLKDLDDAKNRIIPALAALEGKLGTTEGFKQYLDLQREADITISKLSMFSHMRSDLDKRDVANASDDAKIHLLFNDYASAVSYADPEVLKLGKEYVEDFFNKNPDYKDFDFEYEKLFRGQKFVLPADQEKLTSYFGPLQGAGSSLYSQLSVGDYAPKKVTLKDGSEVEVNQANWTTLVSNAKCEEDKQTIFESLSKAERVRLMENGAYTLTKARERLRYWAAHEKASITKVGDDYVISVSSLALTIPSALDQGASIALIVLGAAATAITGFAFARRKKTH